MFEANDVFVLVLIWLCDGSLFFSIHGSRPTLTLNNFIDVSGRCSGAPVNRSCQANEFHYPVPFQNKYIVNEFTDDAIDILRLRLYLAFTYVEMTTDVQSTIFEHSAN